VTVSIRPGKTYEAFMLDVSQYTAARKRRELEIIEFWREHAVDAIRRARLIYKEWDGKKVLTQITEPLRHSCENRIPIT
jgi:hypothetical protein